MTSENDPQYVLETLLQLPAQAQAGRLEELPDPLALAVLEASTRAGLVPVAEALSGSVKKPLAKAAKKSLYQLRSRGVVVPEQKAAPSPTLLSPEEPPPSLVSAITGNGER